MRRRRRRRVQNCAFDVFVFVVVVIANASINVDSRSQSSFARKSVLAAVGAAAVAVDDFIIVIVVSHVFNWPIERLGRRRRRCRRRPHTAIAVALRSPLPVRALRLSRCRKFGLRRSRRRRCRRCRRRRRHRRIASRRAAQFAIAISLLRVRSRLRASDTDGRRFAIAATRQQRRLATSSQ